MTRRENAGTVFSPRKSASSCGVGVLPATRPRTREGCDSVAAFRRRRGQQAERRLEPGLSQHERGVVRLG
jgi:hypothetical protein